MRPHYKDKFNTSDRGRRIMQKQKPRPKIRVKANLPTVMEYIAVFHNFVEDKQDGEKANIILKMRNIAGDKREDIFMNLNSHSRATAFIRQLFDIDYGAWRLIKLEPVGAIVKVNYNINKNEGE